MHVTRGKEIESLARHTFLKSGCNVKRCIFSLFIFNKIKITEI